MLYHGGLCKTIVMPIVNFVLASAIPCQSFKTRLRAHLKKLLTELKLFAKFKEASLIFVADVDINDLFCFFI